MHTGLVFRTVHTELFAFDKGRFKMYPKLFRRQARARQQQATRKKCVKLTMLLLMLWFNEISAVSQLLLEQLVGLTHLYLSGNHMTSQLGQDFALFTQLADLVSLKTLIFEDAGLETLTSTGLSYMEELTTLDLRNNPLHAFTEDVFDGTKKLRTLRTDDPRLCCDYFHQHIDNLICDAPRDELSSCDDLLKSDLFRVFLWTFSLLAVSGNTGVMIYRLFIDKEGTSQTYRILVVNLTLSDLLMGVYLAIIGSADAQFSGVYVSKEVEWRKSSMCAAAGFLALVSSEVSAFVICLVTLDRLLVICFPFNYRLRLTKITAAVTCGATWAIGLLLATIPLLQTDWQFYGQNGICLPLPITMRSFAGQYYAFGVFVILNFVLFLLIGAGQVTIFHSVRSSAKSTMRSDHKKEITIARRLFLIVFTDFCCWFPIGLMGLLASGGVPIPGIVDVLAAVCVLPLNSAVNPFLYTLNTLLERRAEKIAKKRVEKLMRKLHQELPSWPRDKVEELVDYCQRSVLRKRGRALPVTHDPQGTSTQTSTTGTKDT
nr:hypothetical protein BaRGS_012824 [Batillaria attramentaria]